MFQPLGMQDTFFYDDVTEIVPMRANSYEAVLPQGQSGRSRGLQSWRRSLLSYDNVGATSLHTTAEDLLRWAGNFARPLVGDAALIEQVCAMGALSDGTPINYGFGLARRRYAGHVAIEHSGGDAGFRTLFVYFPQSQLGVVLLANSPAEDLAAYAAAIADICLNHSRLPAKSVVPAEVTPELERVAEVTGAYVSEFLPMVTIKAGPDGLLWQVAVGEGRRLVCREDATFDLGDSTRGYACYQFVKNDAGRTAGFENVSGRSGAYGLLKQTYRRIDPHQPTELELSEVVGSYRSTELDITYRFAVEQGRVVARSLWLAEPIVFCASLPDRFDSDCSFMSVVNIVRDPRGKVIGMIVHGSRIRHMKLEKVA